MTTTPAAFVLAFVFLVTPPAAAASPKVTGLIAQWKVAINLCRGAPDAEWDAPETTRACDREDAITRKLNRLGWCYGRKSDEYNALHKWHRCRADSYRVTR